MYTHHKLDHTYDGGVEAAVRYAVCALPRSGSSLLCELLFGTRLAGAPAEYFDRALMKQFRARWGVTTFDDYLDALLARKTGPNGVFGFKAHFFQLAEAFPDGALDHALPSLRRVYITRRDRLRQAISWARAIQSGEWASDHVVKAERPVVFRREQIDRLLAGISQREHRWESLFAASGSAPLRIDYEDLVASPDETVLGVLRHIGVECSERVRIGAPTLRRQADEVTEDWVSRYSDREPERLTAAQW
jgi:trehalose 2-sulfotransferase